MGVTHTCKCKSSMGLRCHKRQTQNHGSDRPKLGVYGGGGGGVIPCSNSILGNANVACLYR